MLRAWQVQTPCCSSLYAPVGGLFNVFRTVLGKRAYRKYGGNIKVVLAGLLFVPFATVMHWLDTDTVQVAWWRFACDLSLPVTVVFLRRCLNFSPLKSMEMEWKKGFLFLLSYHSLGLLTTGSRTARGYRLFRHSYKNKASKEEWKLNGRTGMLLR